MLLFGLVASNATGRLDNALYDLSLRLVHGSPRPDIVIVGVDAQSLAQEGQWPWRRELQAALLADIAVDHPKALAYYFLLLTPGSPEADQTIHDALTLTHSYLQTPLNPANTGRPGMTLKPIPEIASATAGMGPADTDSDDDGVVRRAYLFKGQSDRLVPRIALQIARIYNPQAPTHSSAALNRPSATGVSRSDAILIPYLAGHNRFPIISAANILENQVPKGFFHNKIVLIGPTALGLLDTYPTPVTGAEGMSNVAIEANILNGLLSNRIIYSVPLIYCLLLFLTVLWTFLICLLQLTPSQNLWLGASIAVALTSSAIFGVLFFGYWLPPASCLVTLALLLPYWGWRRLNAASAYFAKELRTLEKTGLAAEDSAARLKPYLGGDVVLQQITLLENAKRRIADLRKFVDDILANFPDPVFVVDREGVIVRVNGAASLFAEALSLPASAGGAIEPILKAVMASGGKGHAVWPPEVDHDPGDGLAEARPLTAVGPDGRAYELRFTATSGTQGEPTGWIVHLADVTPLVSAMRQREEALQLLSHDMRSPQAAIIAILSHPDFKGAAPALRKRIESQARRTLDLADSFVRLAQAESATYEFEPIDVTHILQDAVDAVWPLAQSAKVKVVFQPEEIEYVVLADRRLLTRALINLLDNAIKFSPEGKNVTCRLRPDHFKSKDSVVCEIADSAGGMAQAQLAELFRKFAASREDVSGSQGVGLGLALVHTVITRHQGVIRCESAEGEGTVFTVTLPLCDEADADTLMAAEI